MGSVTFELSRALCTIMNNEHVLICNYFFYCSDKFSEEELILMSGTPMDVQLLNMTMNQ